MKRPLTSLLATVTVALTMVFGAVPAPANAVTPGVRYAAVGDSYAAGTGTAPDAAAPCFQSLTSYPNRLAAYAGLASASFVNVTCSGATTADVPAELGMAGDLSGFSQVTVTIGGNDLGFGAALQSCAADAQSCQTALATAATKLSTITASVTKVIGQIRQAAPRARIFVTGYPLLFGSFSSATCDVGGGVQVPKAVASTINGITGTLNLSIASAVSRAQLKGDLNVRFVPVAPSFYGHGLCDRGTAWINGVRTPLHQSFHPNADGESAYYATLRFAGAV